MSNIVELLLAPRFALRGACLSTALLLVPAAAKAEDFTAGVVMKNMPANERFPFIAGLVEGAAYARFEKDNKNEKGMNCIRQWFYRTKGAVDQIYLAFGTFPNYPPAAVVSSLVNQVCK